MSTPWQAYSGSAMGHCMYVEDFYVHGIPIWSVAVLVSLLFRNGHTVIISRPSQLCRDTQLVSYVFSVAVIWIVQPLYIRLPSLPVVTDAKLDILEFRRIHILTR